MIENLTLTHYKCNMFHRTPKQVYVKCNYHRKLDTRFQWPKITV